MAEVRSPRVTIAEEDADSISVIWAVPVSAGLMGNPYAKYSAHKSGGEKVVDPNASDLIKKVADAQKQMFEQPEIKDIKIFDGENSITFSGYDVGPSHSIAFGSVNNGKVLVHRCSRLAALNTSIYTPPDDAAVYLGAEEPSAAANPAAYIKLVLEKMIENYENNPPEDETIKQVIDKVNEFNKVILKEDWYPVLEASEDATLPGFEGFVADTTCALNLVSTIANVYASASDNFFTRIAQFESLFQMLFIPDATGETCGKFVPHSLIIEDPEDKAVHIRGLDISAGPKSFLPLAGVIVSGLPNPTMYLAGPHTTGNVLVTWPETLPKNGKIETISAPSWIPRELLIPQNETAGGELDPEKIKSYYEQQQPDLESSADACSKIIKEFAKSYYVYNALEPCRASIVTLLDVSWEVGKRYTVRQASGGTLFSGFLQNIEHRISAKPGSPDASTQLTFSHVEANGFTLPNKK
jgi:hypothetical protein